MDAETREVIPDAFLFIENSSIGTSTDLEGKASLEVKNLKQYQIIITHINYINAEFPSSQLSDGLNTILLEATPVEFTEFVVKTKKGNSRKRKRWMKRFESELFGRNFNRGQLKILNPETIWFEEKGDTLVAHAVDNLQIVNNFMAYQMQFVLDHFSHTDWGDLRYEGKLFFEDIKEEIRNKKRIEKRRYKYHLESKRLFFFSLIHRLPINEQQFEFGFTKPLEDKTFDYEAKTYGDLKWKPGLNADTLLLDDYLTIINKNAIPNDIKYKINASNTLKRKKAASFLWSKTGRIVINRYGQILNQKDVEESGFWASLRMGAELPIDYQEGIDMNNLNSPFPILDSLTHYRLLSPQEKIFVHTNQAIYSNREKMWFKAYLANAVNHRPATESKMLYVDLINPEQQIIQTWELHRKTGLAADFQWTRNHDPGTYYLRAYTHFMRNAPSSFFFEKKIEVLDFLSVKEQDNPSLNKKLSAYVVEPEVAFYPEGGDLIAGLSANVAFQVMDQKRRPLEVNGEIRNKDGKKISNCKTTHKGTGIFTFIPEANQAYFFNFIMEGKRYKFPLPQVYPSGMNLHINAKEKNDLYIEVTATEEQLLENAFLVGHVRGAIFLRNMKINEKQNFKIPKGQIPAGLLHFTLFDGQQRPQAERLVFNEQQYLDTLINLSSFVEHSDQSASLRLELTCDSIILQEQKDVSISITNANLVLADPMADNLKSYFLLNSELERYIPEAPSYLQEVDPIKRYYLDLLLLCQSWRRFTWRKLVSGESLARNYEPEAGFSIAGYTTPKGDSTGVQTEVMLNSLDETFIYKKIKTDEQGNFRFSQIPFQDSTTFFLQARINNGRGQAEDGSVKGNRLVDFHLTPRSPAPVEVPQKAAFEIPLPIQLSSEQVAVYREKSRLEEENNPALWTIDLEGVDIEATRSFSTARYSRGKFFNLDAAPWIDPNTYGITMLSQLAPRYNFEMGIEGKLMAIYFDDQGQLTKAPVQISIDGMGTEPGGSNAVRFLGLEADQIQSIYVGRTFISVITRPVPRSQEAYLDSGVLQYGHPGYYRARAFKKQAYLDQDGVSLQSTFYWNPQLTFSPEGKLWIDLESGSYKGPFNIRIEGLTESGELISRQFLLQKLKK